MQKSPGFGGQLSEKKQISGSMLVGGSQMLVESLKNPIPNSTYDIKKKHTHFSMFQDHILTFFVWGLRRLPVRNGAGLWELVPRDRVRLRRPSAAERSCRAWGCLGKSTMNCKQKGEQYIETKDYMSPLL